ncbi:MAG TPA: response regulator [Bryobacteraceae bacterium]|jgi:CheY-like chemotaxis protein|nr:response regulator [Bryobacteraceae bacterium]
MGDFEVQGFAREAPAAPLESVSPNGIKHACELPEPHTVSPFLSPVAIQQREISRLLVVEDNPTDIRMLQRALRAHEVRHEMRVISDGEQAMEYAETCAGDCSPDLIVIDLNLPRQHGLEVLRKFRFAPALVGSRIVIWTSSMSEGEQRRAELIGVDRYIRKPMQIDDFIAIGCIISDLLRARAES